MTRKRSAMLRVEGLGKRYRSGTWGLRGVHVVPESGVTAIVGPAGAGKSTLLRMLAMVTPPTEGSITWRGADVYQRPLPYRRALGYLPEQLGTYDRISGRAFLRYIAALRGLRGSDAAGRVEHMMEALDLVPFAGERMGGYPHDVRWRVGLAQALLGDPALLLVDGAGDPLDAQQRAALYARIGQLGKDRITLVATERAADVAPVASRVGLLNDGHLVSLRSESLDGASYYHPVNDLVDTVRGCVWSVAVDQNDYVALRRTHLISGVAREEGGTRVRILSEVRPHPQAVRVAPTLTDACAYHIHWDAASPKHAPIAGTRGSVVTEGR
jgi:ABC-type multidrug transport system ATPase subunit